jgi:FkbM family methyltransferase
MKRARRSLFGTLKEPGIFNLRMSPLWLSAPMLFLSALRNTRLRQPLTYLGDHTLLVQTVFGHAMYLDSRDLSLTPHLLRQGYWEADTTRFFLRVVKPGMHVVDVGANVGYYTLLACSRVGPRGRVTAFEADPASAALARRSLAVNGYRDRAEIVPMAVIDAAGTATLHRLDVRHGDSSLFNIAEEEFAFPGDRVTDITVPATSLDAHLDSGTPVDLIRMDIEGAEPLVFDGMRQTLERNPRVQIILEFYPPSIRRSGRDGATFLNFVASLGFHIQRIGPGGWLRPVGEDLAATQELSDIFLSR